MMNFKKLFAFALLNFVVGTMVGQGTLPVNSNLLIEYGISPKVLDAALSSTLQEGSYKEKIKIVRKIDGVVDSTAIVMIYDPSYKDGIDIQVGFKKEDGSFLNRKELLKFMQQLHSFSRKSKKYLYDENSLKIESISGDEIILGFLYDHTKLEPEMQHGKKMKGKIFIKNRELVKVELTNMKRVKFMTHRIEAGNLKSTVFFNRNMNGGGHIETSSKDEFAYIRKGKKVEVSMDSETFEYKNKDGIDASWANMPEKTNTEDLDIISKSLGGALPIFGKGALKLGYKLPRPIGANVFMHFQSQTLKLNDIKVGFNGSEKVDVSSLVNFDASSVPQNSQVESFRGDVWVFPFLNISGMVGKGQNRLNGQIYLSDELIAALQKYGWLIGLKPSEVPEFFPIKSELNSITWGTGVTLAGGIGNFNLSLSYQLAWAKVLEVGVNKFAQVINPSIGYRLPSSGVNIMVGGQGQYYNTVTAGSIPLPNPNGGTNNLDFAVNFKPINWNFIVGVYAPVTDHFDISLQSGWGKRSSLTAILGYRF